MVYIDVVLVGVCAVVLVLWGMAFPYPSLLVRRWLTPRKRWPEGVIREWAQTQKPDPGFVRFFYRDPEREIPDEPGLLAPADGKVTSLDVRDDVRYLVIALSFWDVHVQRCPLNGLVESIEELGSEYMDGEGRDFAFLREKACPVQRRITFTTDAGAFVVRLITSFAARRIETFVQEGQDVPRGHRIGRILLGSTVVLELPAALPVMVGCGDRVYAGQTMVAKALVSP